MKQAAGSVVWLDMTCEDASRVKDFYVDVLGVDVQATDMSGYEDFTLTAKGSSEPIAGVCHARGDNASLPSGWIPYFVVEDLDASIASCEKRGGKIVAAPREYGGGRYCIILDPSGTPSALYQT